MMLFAGLLFGGVTITLAPQAQVRGSEIELVSSAEIACDDAVEVERARESGRVSAAPNAVASTRSAARCSCDVALLRVTLRGRIDNLLRNLGWTKLAQRAASIQVRDGRGDKLAGPQDFFRQGALVPTGSKLDVAVAGAGFFRVRLGNGEYRYTRDGCFRLDASNYLVNRRGYRLDPPVQIPPDALEVILGEDGSIFALRTDEGLPEQVTNLWLFRFANPDGLEVEYSNLFAETARSGGAQETQPGTNGAGVVRQGNHERVPALQVDELLALISVPRSYELRCCAVAEIAGAVKSMRPGALESTGSPLDCAIAGAGFFRVRLANGEYGYTREGSFRLDSSNNVVNVDGYPLDPMVQIPHDAIEVILGGDGSVHVLRSETSLPELIGRVSLFRFENPRGLEAQGSNLFLESANSGGALEVTPGIEGAGELRQGCLERVKVMTVDELVTLVLALREYERENVAANVNIDAMNSACNGTR